MPKQFAEVPVDALRARIDPELLPFETTASLEDLKEPVIGQERALDAITFGVGMKKRGYHIFVVGLPKTGLTHLARTYLEARGKGESTPSDWCYVHNFKEPDRPKSLRVSPGRGNELKKDMEDLVSTLQRKIPETLDSEAYAAKEAEADKAFEAARRETIEQLSSEVGKEGFLLQISQAGMVVMPVGEDGQPLSQEQVAEMNGQQRETLIEKSEILQDKMKGAVKGLRELEARVREQKAALKAETASQVVGALMEGHEEKYVGLPEVIEYLKAFRDDVVANVNDFRKKEEGEQPQVPAMPFALREAAFRKYEVNVLVDNSQTRGAPVVLESNPIYPNLFGTIERQAWFGALVTDFTMIKPGALHRANGGYLIMRAVDLIKWYLPWEALKRALSTEEIRIEDVGELYGLFSTRTIRPEPIPLDVKIVLTGDPYLFELLHYYDDRFRKLFKVKAHLDDQIDRKQSVILQFAQEMGRFCTQQGVRHLNRTGAARVIEYCMERSEDKDKLSLELADVNDLVLEADYFAGMRHAEHIGREHVDMAVLKREHRSNLLEERFREMVQTDVLRIETQGLKIGQINGVSLLMTGDYEFGRANRITAAVSVGQEGVVAIERETKMSGNIHTKGVMILTSLLKERFAHNKPLSLSATLCFEQSYGFVEGDSASSTELFALLSALSGVPIDQGIAVTGAVSQKGEIQSVGGVTRKVEAFFDICRERGLTGGQGVVIPADNVRNLMLKQEVVDSVQKGLFHVWPISTVEQGMEILTGMEAGTLQPDGSYPEGTLFDKVDARLMELAEITRRFGRSDGEDGLVGETEEDEYEEEEEEGMLLEGPAEGPEVAP